MTRLVSRLTAKQAVLLLCERCGYERDCNLPDELNQEDTYDCPSCGGWSMHFKYVEADRCKNCRKLGFWTGGAGADGTGDGYCSRRCKLQGQYTRGELGL